jgi:hypothetical protein
MSVTTVTSSKKAVTNLSGLRGASSKELARFETKRLREAAEIIAVAVRAFGSRVGKGGSTRIPKSIRVASTGKAIWIIAEGKIAPNAYPFEEGSTHPLFGDWNHKYTMKKQPFMEEAAAATADAALIAFSEVIDDWVKELKL